MYFEVEYRVRPNLQRLGTTEPPTADTAELVAIVVWHTSKYAALMLSAGGRVGSSANVVSV